MNNLLATLLIQLASQLESLTRRMQREELTVEQWQIDFLRLLAQYLMLTMQRSVGTDNLTISQQQIISRVLREQGVFLEGFARDVRAEGWQKEYIDRARMYAESIREPFWRGLAGCIELPIYPSSPQLDCDGWCRCFLTIVWLDRQNCSANVFWHTTHTEASPDCVQLELKWNPLRIRNGVIQNA